MSALESESRVLFCLCMCVPLRHCGSEKIGSNLFLGNLHICFLIKKYCHILEKTCKHPLCHGHFFTHKDIVSSKTKCYVYGRSNLLYKKYSETS